MTLAAAARPVLRAMPPLQKVANLAMAILKIGHWRILFVIKPGL
jgi:hypothetical protein